MGYCTLLYCIEFGFVLDDNGLAGCTMEQVAREAQGQRVIAATNYLSYHQYYRIDTLWLLLTHQCFSLFAAIHSLAKCLLAFRWLNQNYRWGTISKSDVVFKHLYTLNSVVFFCTDFFGPHLNMKLLRELISKKSLSFLWISMLIYISYWL